MHSATTNQTVDANGYARLGKEYVHIMVWTSTNGPVPTGYLIHHWDWNKLNNSLDNLVCVTPAEHIKIHRGGMPHSAEWNANISASLKGKKRRPHTEEWKKMMSERNFGEKNGFYGKHHTEESKKACASVHIGVPETEGSNRKRSEALKGKKKGPQSEAHKANLSLSHKGKPWSEARRAACKGSK